MKCIKSRLDGKVYRVSDKEAFRSVMQRTRGKQTFWYVPKHVWKAQQSVEIDNPDA